jgi:hypothetical protein
MQERRKGMRKVQQKKQAGFIVSAELVLIATILVIGLIVGMVAIRDALTAEMGDVAEAIGSLDQSYSYDGISDPGTLANIGSSQFVDMVDNNLGNVNEGVQGFAGDQSNINFNLPADGNETNP